MKVIEIFGRKVGEGQPCFIVAEAGSNHNGSIELGKKLIRAAKEAGADAVKFQAFKTEELVIKNAPKANYMKKGKERGLFDLLKKLELGEEEQKELYEYAQKLEMPIFWSIFDKKSADMIERIGANEVFKLASGEITNTPLIEHVAKKSAPLIISTGMADLEEVRDAVETAKKVGNEQIILMHCTTGYPCKKSDVNLRAMKTLVEEFKLPTGYSDHTRGIEVALAAKIDGACIIEKHFTIDKKMGGPDHFMSMDSREFKMLVDGIRKIETGEIIAIRGIETILGSPKKEPTKRELIERIWSRKSVVARKSIKKGDVLGEEMLATKRPATGISPKYYQELIGKKAKHNIMEDTIIKPEDIEKQL